MIKYYQSDFQLIKSILDPYILNIGLFGSIIKQYKKPNDIDIIVKTYSGFEKEIAEKINNIPLSLPISFIDMNKYRESKNILIFGYHVVILSNENTQCYNKISKTSEIHYF